MKTFNVVLHQKLVGFIEQMGLRGQINERTFENNTMSEKLGVTRGVPQESVLGPLFYLLTMYK